MCLYLLLLRPSSQTGPRSWRKSPGWPGLFDKAASGSGDDEVWHHFGAAGLRTTIGKARPPGPIEAEKYHGDGRRNVEERRAAVGYFFLTDPGNGADRRPAPFRGRAIYRPASLAAIRRRPDP